MNNVVYLFLLPGTVFFVVSLLWFLSQLFVDGRTADIFFAPTFKVIIRIGVPMIIVGLLIKFFHLMK